MIFDEEYLFEVSFENEDNKLKHYNRHVMQPGEIFDPDNPKYPYMTVAEYAAEAKELSELPAMSSEDRDPSKYIVGFQIKDPISGKHRCVKVRKKSKFFSHETRLSDVVMYVDDDERGHEIISLMVGRPGKLFRLKQQFVDELPENKIDKTVEHI